MRTCTEDPNFNSKKCWLKRKGNFKTIYKKQARRQIHKYIYINHCIKNCVREVVWPAKSFFRSSRPERDSKTGATTYVGSE